MSRRKIHPDDWTCPSCRKRHTKPHWKDYHQKEPGWKGKLGMHGTLDKGSDPNFQNVCEVCGQFLDLNKKEPAQTTWCPKCKVNRPNDTAKYCKVCGRTLTTKERERNWCPDCKAERHGILAPLFCPHCGWEEERVILVRTND